MKIYQDQAYPKLEILTKMLKGQPNLSRKNDQT